MRPGDASADSAARFERARRRREKRQARCRRPCTGLTARWCPRCGNCSCGEYPAEMNSEMCPLHAPTSPHADPPLTDREVR